MGRHQQGRTPIRHRILDRVYVSRSQCLWERRSRQRAIGSEHGTAHSTNQNFIGKKRCKIAVLSNVEYENIFPAWTAILAKFLPISTRMIILLRHSDNLREADGAIHWNVLMPNFNGFEKLFAGWTSEDWKRCLTHGTDKIVFEYSLDNRSESNTSVQGHSGGVPTNPKLLSNVQMPCGWTDYIYHVESASDHTSVSDVGPVAAGFGVRQGQRTRFFTAVDPVNIPLLAP